MLGKYLTLIFMFIACSVESLEPQKCACYNRSNPTAQNILYLIWDYEDFAKSQYLSGLLPKREQWEDEYWKKFNHLNSLRDNSVPRSLLYPDVKRNALVFAQIVDLSRDQNIEYYNRSYPKDEKTREENQAKVNARWCLTKQKLSECNAEIEKEYQVLFQECIKKHASLVTIRDYGLYSFMNREFDKSIELLEKFIESSQQSNALGNAQSQKYYHDLGLVCLDAMKYEKAIDYLTKAINQDPSKKALYFSRARAYFETGDFELAIQDYTDSDSGKSVADAVDETASLWDRYQQIKAPIDFQIELVKNLAIGTAEAATEFVPTLCDTMYGLGTTLWSEIEYCQDFVANLPDPSLEKLHESIQCFAGSCYELGDTIATYFQEMDLAEIAEDFETGLYDHLHALKSRYNEFGQLTAAEQGELVGYTIGKYGTNFFIDWLVLKGATKSVCVVKNIENANRMCNLEALASSTVNQDAIKAAALKHNVERNAFFDQIKFSRDKQNKHVVGAHNFVPKNSIFEHHNPEKLIKDFKGTGTPVGKLPPGAGYKEKIDFKEHIGFWKNEKNTEILKTTKGTIHYSKNDAHIVPAHPKE